MSVTLQLPTVLAKLADGQRSLQAQGSTLGDVVADVVPGTPEPDMFRLVKAFKAAEAIVDA